MPRKIQVSHVIRMRSGHSLQWFDRFDKLPIVAQRRSILANDDKIVRIESESLLYSLQEFSCSPRSSYSSARLKIASRKFFFISIAFLKAAAASVWLPTSFGPRRVRQGILAEVFSSAYAWSANTTGPILAHRIDVLALSGMCLALAHLLFERKTP